MYGYPPNAPPPRPPSGPSVGLIVGLVVGAFALVMVGLMVAGGAVAYMTARAHASASSAPAKTSPPGLTQRYPTKNALAVAHYPADFAAKSIDDGTLLVSRNLDDGTDESVVIGAVNNPISDDVGEFSRVLVTAMTKKIASSGATWTETSRASGPCFLGHAGISVEGKFVAGGRTEEHVRACYFMANGHGYEMKTVVAAAHEAGELPLLASILEATELE